MTVTPADIVAQARSLIGIPWIHQGIDPEFGIDCRGMLLVIADRCGYVFKDYNSTYRRRSPAIELREALNTEFHLSWVRYDKTEELPLDLMFASNVALIKFPRDTEARHVGIIADGLYERTIVHAYEPLYGGGKVAEEPLRRWQHDVVAIFQWIL